MARKILSLILSFGLLFQQISFAQVALELNLASYLSRIGSNVVQDKFRPIHLRYFSYYSLNYSFKLLVDKGDLGKGLSPSNALKQEAQTLLNYFLIGVALPDEMFWVNLRPDSENQIIDQYLEKTDVGKIMLETDLQLKKDTALFTSPQTSEGREYWDKLYKKAEELYGYESVTIPTLTRPWIVPGEIIVREAKDSAYIYKATLKVMLEQDYLKDTRTPGHQDTSMYSFKNERSKALNEYSTQLIRELIIPKLTKEVNSSKRYANFRQVYYSLILSRWFKLRFTGKTGTYATLINTQDLTNLISQESWSKTDYFKQYQKSFSEGEYNVKEPVYTPTGQVIRSYFSGGIQMGKEAGSPINNPSGFTARPIHINNLPNTEIVEGNSVTGISSAGSPVTSEKKESISLLGGTTQEKVLMAYEANGHDLIKTAMEVGGLNLDTVTAYIEDAKRRKGSSPIATQEMLNLQKEYELMDAHHRIEQRVRSGLHIDLLTEVVLDGKGILSDTANRFLFYSATADINRVLKEEEYVPQPISSLSEEDVLSRINNKYYEIGNFGIRYPINISEEETAEKLAAFMVLGKNLKKKLSIVLYSDNPGAIDLSKVLKVRGHTVKSPGEEDAGVGAFTLLVNFATTLDKASKLLDCESRFKLLVKDKKNSVTIIVLPDISTDAGMLTAIRVFSRARALYDAASSSPVKTSSPVRTIRDSDGTVFSVHAITGINKDQLKEAVDVLKYRKGSVLTDIWLVPDSKRQIYYSTDWKIAIDDGMGVSQKVWVALKDDQDVTRIKIGYSDSIALKYSEETFNKHLQQALVSAVVSSPIDSTEDQLAGRGLNFDYMRSLARLSGMDLMPGNIASKKFPIEIEIGKIKFTSLEVIQNLKSDLNVYVINLHSRSGSLKILVQDEEGPIKITNNSINPTDLLDDMEAEKIMSAFEAIQSRSSVTKSVAASPVAIEALKQRVDSAFKLLEGLIGSGELTREQIDTIYSSTEPIRLVLEKGLVYNKREAPIESLGLSVLKVMKNHNSTIIIKGIQSWARLINVDRDVARGYTKEFESIFKNVASSSVNTPETTGGIDLRALPMTIQPMGSFKGLNFSLPQLSQEQLKQFNISSEIGQVKNMVKAGNIPSGERLKELIAACVQKGQMTSQIDNLLLCLTDTFKLEEENALESSSELREALVIVDSIS